MSSDAPFSFQESFNTHVSHLDTSEMEDRHSRDWSLSGRWKCRNLGQVVAANNFTFSTAAMM